jgi:hypothetical protein
MAKKATKKPAKKKSSGRSKKNGMMDIDFQKILGIGGGLYGGSLLNKIIPADWDPKVQAVVKIAIGELGPKQQFVKNMLKEDSMRNGIGAGVIAKGLDEPMVSLALPGYEGLRDDDELAVVLEGDIDTVNGDIDTVNEDVLGDDDIDEDVLGEDLDDEDDGASYDE